jgi:adenine-specific DNA-methyltransferase
MRYLGNKSKLLNFIESVIEKYNIEGETFADLFAGTGSVGDYFKGKYRIIANDYMYFSKVINKAKLLNNTFPNFKRFIEKYEVTPFEWLNSRRYEPQDNYFVYQNYTPVGGRMYFTEENALRIDGIRLDIEELYKLGIFDEKEYVFLLASLIESVTKVSNTSGTYQAFFKFWESRALKPFVIVPLEMNESISIDKYNTFYNTNTNKLVREISGDIAYIDPPYTITQYTNSYHLLETIARYDYPEIFGKTGRRSKRELSGYSNKQKALYEFEDLLRQINFNHVLVSYSNQSIVPLEELIDLAKLFAVDNEVFVETNEYREYATNNNSYKGNGTKLKEVIIYFKKNNKINKSPLNYSGSKDVLLPIIFKQLPKHVGTFVDAMGGAFNVGANVFATKKVVYNEYNPYVYGIVEMLVTKDNNQLIQEVTEVVNRFGLKKKEKDSYINLRNHYNNIDNSSLNLFTMQIYAFQNMIRFNSSQKMNTPVGNNEFNEGTKERIEKFKINSPEFELLHGKYEELAIDEFPKDTIFYFDPPYFITNAEYNDGKRGLDGWDAEKESGLLNFLSSIDQKGYKFMLSNVIEHRGKQHHLLIEWIQTHDFNVVEIGKTGIKYPRTEVLITNYDIFEKY